MIKTLLYNTYNPLPFLIPFKTLIRITNQRLLILVYHTVCDVVPAHLRHLYQPRSVQTFTEDLDYLLAHYEPIDLHRLKEIVLSGEKQVKNSFFISFDDGLSEFYSTAAPILFNKGIPAIGFLNTAFIDNNDLFYRYKVSILIEEIQKHKENRNFWQEFHALKEKFGISQGYYRTVLKKLDQVNINFIDEIARLIDVSFTDYLRIQKPYLTSNQINELIKQGFTFGGHGIDHSHFGRLESHEQLRQAVVSTQEVAKQFNLDYKVFAFPFTDHNIDKTFFDSVYLNNQVELSFGCAGIKHDSEYRNLQRIPMEEFALSAVRRLKTDYFYYLIKSLFGKNIINRN
jgi:peptidoglycan/xylan/chitin deacetylase (PgdA/CDA1 family)